MKRHFAWLLTLMALATFPLSAQRREQPRAHQGGERPRANQGHPPPAPTMRRGGGPEAERLDGGRMNSMPHVNHDRWYGHDGTADSRYRLARPFDRGRFAHIGPSYRYGISRFDRGAHRFWLGSSAFLIAPWDWALAGDWCWDCGDDFVVYDDPDHPGWYLLYNLQTGGYIHVQYGG
jgi:hypothetical protein